MSCFPRVMTPVSRVLSTHVATIGHLASTVLSPKLCPIDVLDLFNKTVLVLIFVRGRSSEKWLLLTSTDLILGGLGGVTNRDVPMCGIRDILFPVHVSILDTCKFRVSGFINDKLGRDWYWEDMEVVLDSFRSLTHNLVEEPLSRSIKTGVQVSQLISICPNQY